MKSRGKAWNYRTTVMPRSPLLAWTNNYHPWCGRCCPAAPVGQGYCSVFTRLLMASHLAIQAGNMRLLDALIRRKLPVGPDAPLSRMGMGNMSGAWRRHTRHYPYTRRDTRHQSSPVCLKTAEHCRTPQNTTERYWKDRRTPPKNNWSL